TSELITNLNEVLHYAKQLCFYQVEVSKALKQQRIGLLHKTIRTAFVGLLLVVAVLCVGWVALKFYPKTEQQKLFSGVVEVHEIEVGSKVGGRVKEVLVQEGDIVKANQPIIRFDINELLAERKQAEARVEQAKAYLNKLLNGSRPEEIAQAEAAMRRELASLEQLRNGPRPQEVAEVKAGLLGAESDLQTAETIYQRLQAVFHTGYISKQDRDDAENTRNQAKARRDALQEKLKMLELGTRAEEIRAAEERYKQALANVQLLRSGTRKEDIADAQAKLMEAEAVVENLNVRIREGEVSSPVESKVEVIDVRPGDLLSPGRTVAKLLEKEQIWVRTYVPETELPRIRVGQQAIVTIDSLPNLHIEGHVKEINSEGEFLPRNIQSRNERKHQVFGVKVYIDNSQGLFKSGMSADITFLE
ncbi:MAG: efflux RND transporter periplasmic adaptor subunit, partial [Blastocatellia bacterium]|nr:efflux RND transporter periplasmic adaptor subunit [Blastocatellia bacterium]